MIGADHPTAGSTMSTSVLHMSMSLDAGHWNGVQHDGVPIFVPTRGQPPEESASALVHYVTDGVESAKREANKAAGDKASWCTAPILRGPSCAQACSTNCRFI
jgi:hypothetical protein